MQEEVKVILKDGTNYISPMENVENIRRVLAGKIKSITPIGKVEVTTSKTKKVTN